MNCPVCGDGTSAADAKFCEGCGQSLTLETVVSVAIAPISSAAAFCACPPGKGKPDAQGYCENCGVRCIRSTDNVPDKHFEHGESRLSNPHRFEKELGSIAVVGDRGFRHEHNEDFGAVARDPHGRAVLVVADGVSTSFEPAFASSTAVRSILESLQNSLEDDFGAAELTKAVLIAHQEIIAGAGPLPRPGDGPECTVVAAWIQGMHAHIAWIGDSRAYRLTRSEQIDDDVQVELLTCDDSWVEMVIANGEMSRGQAEQDLRAHCVTQVLGMTDAPIEVHTLQIVLGEDDILMICTDGLWNYFPTVQQMADRFAFMHSDRTALQIAATLTDTAVQLGGHDNVTVAVFVPK